MKSPIQTQSIPLSHLLALAVLITGGCDEQVDHVQLATSDASQMSDPASTRTVAGDFISGLDPVAILPGFDVQIAAEGEDLVFSWSAIGTNGYEVWRSDDPYFQPGDPESEIIGLPNDPTFIVQGDICQTCSSRYYIVVARSTEQTQLVSTTVGAQMIRIYDGYNKIPMALVTPEISSASDLEPMAGEGLLGMYIWSASTQHFTGGPTGFPQSEFEFGLGESPVLHLTLPGPEVRVLTGYVPSESEFSMNLQVGDNLVTLPLTHPSMSASELLEMIPDATRIGRWDPSTQQTLWYPGVDFIIPSGGDLHVEVSTPIVWPVALPDPDPADPDPPPVNPLNDEFDGDLSGWQILNDYLAQIELVDGRLRIRPVANSVWYHGWSATLIHKPLDGDFVATVDLSVRGIVDPNSPPPATFRVGGLMARNPDPSNGENYVFIGMGADFMTNALETKTTVDSYSEFVETLWPGTEGKVRICRVGSYFELLVREYGGSWQSAAVYERPDLPEQLEVGMFSFSSNADPDVQAWFDWAHFNTPNGVDDCMM